MYRSCCRPYLEPFKQFYSLDSFGGSPCEPCDCWCHHTQWYHQPVEGSVVVRRAVKKAARLLIWLRSFGGRRFSCFPNSSEFLPIKSSHNLKRAEEQRVQKMLKTADVIWHEHGGSPAEGVRLGLKDEHVPVVRLRSSPQNSYVIQRLTAQRQMKYSLFYWLLVNKQLNMANIVTHRDELATSFPVTYQTHVDAHVAGSPKHNDIIIPSQTCCVTHPEGKALMR